MLQRRQAYRLLAVAGLGVAGVAAAVLLLWVTEPPRRVLYASADEAERAQMIDALAADGIDARINAEDGQLTVRPGDYHRARLALARRGLPALEQDGQAAIEAMPMGLSRAVEGFRLKQSIEMELAATLARIEGVRSARVLIARDDGPGYVGGTRAASASVVLALAAGHALSEEQIHAVTNLVASAVPGLDPARVSLVDQRGRWLSRMTQDPRRRAMAERLAFQAEVEQALETKLERVLTSMFGEGAGSVAVSARMDFDARQSTSERYIAPGVVEQENTSSSQGQQLRAAGIPGSLSNRPVNPAAPAAAAEIVDRDESASRRFAVGKSVAVTEEAVGKVVGLSVAVVLGKPVRLTAPVRRQLEVLLRESAGLDPARGDRLSIAQAVAEAPGDPPVPAIWERPQLVDHALRAVATLIIGAIAFVILRRLLRLMSERQPAAQRDDAPAVPAVVLAPDTLQQSPNYTQKLSLVRSIAADDVARTSSAVRRMLNAPPAVS